MVDASAVGEVGRDVGERVVGEAVAPGVRGPPVPTGAPGPVVGGLVAAVVGAGPEEAWAATEGTPSVELPLPPDAATGFRRADGLR